MYNWYWFICCIAQVPVYTPDYIFKQSIWLPVRSHCYEVVDWFKSWSIPCNDIHVPKSYRWARWKPAFQWSENSSGSPSISFLNLIFISLVKVKTCEYFLYFVCSFNSLCYYYWLLFLYHGCCFQSPLYWRCNIKMYVCRHPFTKTLSHFHHHFFPLFIFIHCFWWLCYFSGTKANPTPYLRTQKRACKWIQTMMPMVMGSLNLVRFSYIKWYTP